MAIENGQIYRNYSHLGSVGQAPWHGNTQSRDASAEGLSPVGGSESTTPIFRFAVEICVRWRILKATVTAIVI